MASNDLGVVMITGVTGNLGKAFTNFFLKKGYRVAGLDIDQDRLNDMSSEVESTSFKGYMCDITHLDRCKDVYSQIESDLGPVEILINNAGITHIERYKDTSDPIGVIRRVMDVNFMGSVHCTHVSLNALIERKGTVITISSVAGFAPLLGRTAYAASKHALHGFFESLDAELDDVRFLMVCPGFIAVDEQRKSNAAIHQKKTIIGPKVRPEDIVNRSWNALTKGKKVVTCGRTATLSFYIKRFLPSFYFSRMKKKLQKEL